MTAKRFHLTKVAIGVGVAIGALAGTAYGAGFALQEQNASGLGHAYAGGAAAAEERSRIARELHDVVSHAISVTVLQARGARRSLEHDPQDARAALTDAGVMRMCVPAAYGGREADPLAVVEVIEAIARDDGAAGWCTSRRAGSGPSTASRAMSTSTCG